MEHTRLEKKLATTDELNSGEKNFNAVPTGHLHKKWFRLVFFLWPLLSFISLVLPFLLKYIINRSLSKQGAGRVRGLRLSFVHPSCVIKGYHFEKVDIWEEEMLDCSAGVVKLSFSWKTL